MLLNDHVTEVDTLRDLIAARSGLGSKPLLIVDDEVLSYADADRRSNSVAHALVGLGVAKGSVVASYMYNSPDHFVLWMACVKLGAIWAPLNVSLVGQDLHRALTSCDPGAVVVDGELLGNYLDSDFEFRGARIIRGEAPDRWLGWEEVASDSSEPVPSGPLDAADPVALIFTGGTTGLPKGVLITNAYCIAGCLRYQELFDPSPSDVHIGVGQMFHAIGSVIDVLCPMYAGMTAVSTRWFSARRFWTTVRQYGGTISVLLGAVMVALLARPVEEDGSGNTLRIAGSVTGGMERARVAEFADRFGVRLLEMYGQTETGAPCCISQRTWDEPYASQGKPYGWAQVMIAEPDGAACAAGTEGEILIRMTEPATFMAGYHRAPELFVERCRDLWFHTGDTGYLDADGNLHFTGRQAHKIRRRGENVSADEVEQVLRQEASVADCTVVGVPLPDGDEAVKAFVMLRPGHTDDPRRLVEYCATQLAYFKVPRFVEFVTEFPRSASKGDVLRHVLRARGNDRAWDRDAAGVPVHNQAFRP